METMFKALVKGKKCLDTFEIKEIGIFSEGKKKNIHGYLLNS